MTSVMSRKADREEQKMYSALLMPALSPPMSTQSCRLTAMKHSRLHIDVAFAHIFVDIWRALLSLSPVSSALEPMQPHDRSAIEAKADAAAEKEAKTLVHVKLSGRACDREGSDGE
jgi:hypothetical protein